MRRLAHISDLHFGKTDAAVVAALARELTEFAPDLLVVTGDLTQRAKHGQFEEARNFLASLPFERLVVPGNHDIAPLYNPGKRLLAPFGRYLRYLGAKLDATYLDDEILVLGLNSVQPLRWKEGSVSRSQIAWIVAQAERYADRFHVLAAHHPLVHVEDDRLGHRVRRSPSLLQALNQVGIDLVLTGHLHETFNGPAASSFSASESLLVAQASTATSTRLRGHKNAYNRILIDGGRVSIEVRVSGLSGFETEREKSYQKTNGAWRHVTRGEPLVSGPASSF